MQRSRTYRECRALALLASWMKEKDLTTSHVARRLDRTWPFTDWLLRGYARPSLDDALTLRQLAGVPLEAWKVEKGKVAA